MPSGGHNKNIKQREFIFKCLSDGQWHTSTELKAMMEDKDSTIQTMLYNMSKAGELQRRKMERTPNWKGKLPFEYRKVPSNLFNADEFYDHYRDPVGEGMSLKRHLDHAHL